MLVRISLLFFLFLAACASAPENVDQRFQSATAPAVQKAYDQLRADEYDGALAALYELLEDGAGLTPFERASILELRASAKRALNDREGAKADLEAAYALNALPPDRQETLLGSLASLEEPAQYLPVVRVRPEFPDSCMRVSAEPDEYGFIKDTVEVGFDIENGVPENVRILNTTNECFNGPALEAVRLWRFDPVMKYGEPLRVEDQKTQFGYEYPAEDMTR